MNTNPLTLLSALYLCLPIPPAHADNVAGHFSGTRQSADTVEVSKGSKLTAYTTYSMISSENSPLNGWVHVRVTVSQAPMVGHQYEAPVHE
jgi:hypothetical protein